MIRLLRGISCKWQHYLTSSLHRMPNRFHFHFCLETSTGNAVTDYFQFSSFTNQLFKSEISSQVTSNFPFAKVQMAETDWRQSRNQLLITFVIAIIAYKFYPKGPEDCFVSTFLHLCFSRRFFRISYRNPEILSKPVKSDRAGFNLNTDPSLRHPQILFVWVSISVNLLLTCKHRQRITVSI